jgi:predicted esterase
VVEIVSGDAFARRRFLRLIGGGAAVAFAASCGALDVDSEEPRAGSAQRGGDAPSSEVDDADDPVRLIARPDPDVTAGGVQPGLQPLGIVADRDATLFVPREALRGSVPLMVTLHGAGGGRHGGLGRFREAAARGVALLLPLSRGPSCDIIVEGAFGSDIEVIDAALAATFERIPVDPDAVALAGFSDGASYALTVGLANGNLFPFVIGSSPGFIVETERRGRPDVFVAHGRQDRTLPIDQSSRSIVPDLRAAGYDVTYVEFEGEHELPPAIAGREIDWFLDGAGRR